MGNDHITPTAAIVHPLNPIAYSDAFFSLALHKKPHPQLGFLASHSGSSMQCIITALKQGILPGTAQIVISNNADSPALLFAQSAGIATAHISRQTHGSAAKADHAIAEQLHDCDWVILSGYMRPIGNEILSRFPQKIINIHPSLLPDFGGQGMYGSAIHEAVIASGITFSGITIHLVNHHYDRGPILAQLQIPIKPNDTARELEKRIKLIEPDFFITVLRKLL